MRSTPPSRTASKENQPVTEDHLERIVQRTMNQLDKLLLTNEMTQDEYDQEVRELDQWAREMYRNLPKDEV